MQEHSGCPCCHSDNSCECHSNCKGCACSSPFDAKQTYLNDGIQLWTLHIGLEREYIVEVVNRLPGLAKSTLKLLLEVGRDTAEHYEVAYPRKGKELARLLSAHVKQMAIVVNKSASGQDVKRSVTAWRRNGREIVEFLEKNDENFDADRMSELWTMHLDMGMEQTKAIIKRDYKLAAKISKEMVTGGREMADLVLSSSVSRISSGSMM